MKLYKGDVSLTRQNLTLKWKEKQNTFILGPWRFLAWWQYFSLNTEILHYSMWKHLILNFVLNSWKSYLDAIVYFKSLLWSSVKKKSIVLKKDIIFLMLNVISWHMSWKFLNGFHEIHPAALCTPLKILWRL